MNEAEVAETGELAQYTLEDESVERAVVGSTRTVAVTDRRFIEVSEGETSSGRAVETIESTLFSGVQKVNVDIRGSTTETNTLQLLFAVLAGIFGVIALFGAAEADNVGLVVVALLLFGVAAWLYLTAAEHVSGGIAVRFGYVSNGEWVTDTYRLPEGNIETAHAAAKAVGKTHAP